LLGSKEFFSLFLGFNPPEETSEGSLRPTIVLYRINGENVAVGYLHPERHTLHGKPVSPGFDVVQLTWVADKEGAVTAPNILGDVEENGHLLSGKFFALPRAQLAKVRVIQENHAVLQRKQVFCVPKKT